jgi:hypothetical protein
MPFAKQKTVRAGVILTNRELATVIAALRFWQRKGPESNGLELDIAHDGGTIKHALSNHEIDALIVEINMGDRDCIPMPAALTTNLTSAQDADLIEKSRKYDAALGVEENLAKHRRAQITKHRHHALRISERGVYCKHCQEIIIHDADMLPPCPNCGAAYNELHTKASCKEVYSGS